LGALCGYPAGAAPQAASRAVDSLAHARAAAELTAEECAEEDAAFRRGRAGPYWGTGRKGWHRAVLAASEQAQREVRELLIETLGLGGKRADYVRTKHRRC